MSERKSGKQRREEIKQKRLERAARLQVDATRPDARWANRGSASESGMQIADREILARNNNTYGALPQYYLDREFTCRDCDEQHVWTAKQQKWWYEVAHGHIDSVAVRCLPCRRKRRASTSRPGSDRLRVECARIRALGEHAPDTATRAEIDMALASKWWGLRVVAIATLGRWGDAQAVARLKTIVQEGDTAKRWGSWLYEGSRAAHKALGECLPASEAEWALEHCLRSDDSSDLYPRIVAQHAAYWEAVIAEEWRRDEPARLQRLVWLLRAVPTNSVQAQRWRERFRSHTHRLVRQAAEYAWRLPG